MARRADLYNQSFITTSVIFSAIALILACVGVGTPNWQTTSLNTSTGDLLIVNTANLFYACEWNLVGDLLNCYDRRTNSSIVYYYRIRSTGDEADWNFHLNTAASFSIIGIFFIFIGSLATIYMFFADEHQWMYLVTPTFLFLACLSMRACLSEGSRVLYYNGYSVNLFQTAQSLMIFSLLFNSIVAGRIFQYTSLSKPAHERQIQRVTNTPFFSLVENNS